MNASEEPVRTYCRICEAACGLTARLEPGGVHLAPDREHPVSRGFVCAKGTRFAEVALHESRVTRPQVRRGAAWQAASWERAIERAAAKLSPILERHGPHAIGLYVGNPLAFNAVGQLAAIFFGRALGTRNVFTAGSQDCNNKFAAARILHGSQAIHPIPDFDHAELAVLFGTNPAVSQSSFVHLEGGSSIFDRMQRRGARIVWVDVRQTESARRWGELVTVRPGTDVWLILSLLHELAERAPRGDARVQGLGELLALAREVPPERAEALTGVEAARIRELAAAIARHRTALHMSVGVNQGPFGTLSYIALQALAYCSGNYDRRGGSIFSPVGTRIARLAHAAGLFTSSEPNRVGGFPRVFDSVPGGVMADEILEDGPERVRAMIVIAGDPLRSIPGAARLEAAFERLDAMVCVDLFETSSSRHADVLLPCTSWLERADLALPGLPLQTVDLLQTSPAVLPPVGETRPDHEILAQLSLALDRPLFGSRAVSRMLATRGLVDRWLPRASNALFSLTDRRPDRRGYGIRVPRPRERRYLGRGPMTPGAKVRFWHPDLDAEAARLRRSAEAPPAPEGAFLLLGRRRRLGHNSWLHGATREGRPEGDAWMARSDLDSLGLEDGGAVRLRTRAGELTLPARAKEGVQPGTIVIPHGELEHDVNRLLPAGREHIEPISGQLHMSGVPVQLEAAHARIAMGPASEGADG